MSKTAIDIDTSTARNKLPATDPFSAQLRDLSLHYAAKLLDAVSSGILRIPTSARYLPADAVTLPLSYLWRPRIEVIARNFATMLDTTADDPLAQWLARQSIHNYGRMAIDFLASRTMTAAAMRAVTTTSGEEHLADALRDDKGVIFALAHVGSWDTAAVLAEAYDCKLTVVTESDWATELVAGSRVDHGVTLVPRDRSLRALFRALARKEFVVLLSDIANDGVQTIDVPFFGKPAPYPVGPARLALHTGAPILVISSVRMPDMTYHVSAQAPLRADASKSTDENIYALTAAMALGFQRIITAYPEHWYPFHPIWPSE